MPQAVRPIVSGPACPSDHQETEEERQRLDQEAREGMQEYRKLIQDIWAVCHHDSAHGKKRQCTSAVFAQELAEGGNIRAQKTASWTACFV